MKTIDYLHDPLPAENSVLIEGLPFAYLLSPGFSKSVGLSRIDISYPQKNISLDFGELPPDSHHSDE
jgi:hypothetical protein